MLRSSESVHPSIAPPREWDVAPSPAAPAELAPSSRLEAFLAAKSLPTPYLVIDLDVIAARHRAFRTGLPDVEI